MMLVDLFPFLSSLSTILLWALLNGLVIELGVQFISNGIFKLLGEYKEFLCQFLLAGHLYKL